MIYALFLSSVKVREIELTQWRSSATTGSKASACEADILSSRRTRGREALALEHMSKVATTVCTSDLRPRHAVRGVVVTVHRSWDRCASNT